MGIDDAFKRFEALASEIALGLVEASTEQDTRLKVINRLLTEVLGWPYSQIKTEEPNKKGYADYALKDDKGRTLCVLEAKKTGKLTVDTASSKKTEVLIGGQVLKPAMDGVDQAVGYCTETSAGYAAVTDGDVWIFFRLRTDGIPFREGKAIVFPSFTSVLEDFATFFELLALEALLKRLHLARISQAEGVKPRIAEPRYFVRSPEEAHLQVRTELGRDVAEVFNRFFSGMASDQDVEMRTSCFVETQESRVADATLAKIASQLTNTIQQIETEHSEALQEELEAVIQSHISEICLIVGNKGAGKSTFITRFFDDVLPPQIKRACVIASIDLSDFTGDEHSIQRWLAERLRDNLEDAIFRQEEPTYEDYMGMFFRVYKRWSEATYRDLYATDKTKFRIQFGEYVEKRREDAPDDYAQGLMRHAVAGRKRLPCVIFDNTDQFSMKIQEAVFQYAVSLRNAAVCFLVVPITDRSIWRLSKAGSFQSYVSRTFYLPTPPAKEILARRIIYIKSKLEQDEAASGIYFSSKGIRISIKNLNGFVNVLEEAFVRDERLSGLIGRLSNFDIRRMLLLAQRTICSPTFRVDDLVRIYVDTSRRAFDFRRALRAMITGEYDRHIVASNEFVANLFWTDGGRPHTPLLSLSILAVLANTKIRAGTDVDRMYLAISGLVDFFEPCGIDPEDVRLALAQLLEYRLLEPFEPNTETYSAGTRVAITYSGETHMDLALNEAVYLEQMALVTGYRFEAVRDEQVANARDMGNAALRDALVGRFVTYLLSEDDAKIWLPTMDAYKPLRQLRSDFRTPRR